MSRDPERRANSSVDTPRSRAKPFKQALVDDGIPYTSFAVDTCGNLIQIASQSYVAPSVAVPGSPLPAIRTR